MGKKKEGVMIHQLKNSIFESKLTKNHIWGSAVSHTDSIFPMKSYDLVTAPTPIMIECNKKKGGGCTLEGTTLKKIRTSGFRARMASKNGRKVLARRRAKGRAVLCPSTKKATPRK